MKQLFIFIIYIFFCYFNGYSQSNSLYFVQFKITTVNTEKEAKTVDNKIARKKGIISTHTDHITSTYFCAMVAILDFCNLGVGP